MKLDPTDLAFALAARTPPDAPVTHLAQYIIDHPTSTAGHASAIELLGIDDLPSETWGHPLPELAAGELVVGTAVARLNKEYPRGNLHALIALRRLAWHSSQLARAVAARMKAEQAAALANNGGNTAGLFQREQLSAEAQEQFKTLLGRKPRARNHKIDVAGEAT